MQPILGPPVPAQWVPLSFSSLCFTLLPGKCPPEPPAAPRPPSAWQRFGPEAPGSVQAGLLPRGSRGCRGVTRAHRDVAGVPRGCRSPDQLPLTPSTQSQVCFGTQHCGAGPGHPKGSLWPRLLWPSSNDAGWFLSRFREMLVPCRNSFSDCCHLSLEMIQAH